MNKPELVFLHGQLGLLELMFRRTVYEDEDIEAIQALHEITEKIERMVERMSNA